ncbi:MAG: glycosyltransferase [Bacteroidales bacterium]|nr:glycosyltransferase [Bacteroidales bacterium]
MTSNQLTIIITFLNEGIEIANTLKSIRQTVGNAVDILLIDDNSNDGFAYEETAYHFHALYHRNDYRLGVAASRDLGVSMIKSPYFLILDGHMRFYDNHWHNRIISLLEEEEKLLLCCQTKILYKKNGEVYDGPAHSAYGAYIDFSGENNLLSAIWNSKELKADQPIEEIPCVLGATYACSKSFWEYIKGLQGLRYYGCDETYMSLKVWLSGGKCKLIKDITVGHIYRDAAPYRIDTLDTTYNKMLIAELLLPDTIKKNIFTQFKLASADNYNHALSLLEENKELINRLRIYYQSIFEVNFDPIYEWNLVSQSNKKQSLLKRISNHLMLNASFTKDLGLYNGKMGIVIFFAHYAKYAESKKIQEFAEILLDEIYDQINWLTPLDLESGLCGIGWGLEYLVQNGFMTGNTDEILEEIDKKVMEYAPLRIQNLTIKKGIGGILNYVYMRLLSSKKKNKKSPFDPLFLEELLKIANKYSQDKKANSIKEISKKYISLCNSSAENNGKILLSSVVPLNSVINEIENTALGLENGCAGFGLKKMIES